MYVCHSQFLQVVNTGCQFIGTDRSRFRHGKELTFIFNARRRIYRKITMMHLIDNHIRRRRQWRTLILFPAFRIGFTHIDNGGTLSVHTYCMRIDAWCITQPLTVDFHIESIELAFQVLLYLSRPRTVFSRRHGHCFISMPAVSRIV